MIKNMKPGSLIYDLAAAQGGNAAFTEVDKIIDKNGVKIMGERNILNKLPTSASTLYSKNLFNFISNLCDKKSKEINIVNGVKIMGAKNILNNLALSASYLYAKNLFNFINNLYDKKKKDIYINKEDEIIRKTLIDKEL